MYPNASPRIPHPKALHHVLLAVTLATSTSARAGTHVWTGAGGDKYWSTASNWSGGVPSANEAAPVIIEFPSGSTGSSTNNLVGLKVDSLRLLGSGVLLRGTTGVSLTFKGTAYTNLHCTGINYIDTSLPVVLEGTNRVAAPVLLTINSRISGAGAVEIDGTVQLDGSQANTFTGGTTLKSGQLTLDKAFLLNGSNPGVVSVPGPLLIKGGRLTLGERDGIAGDAAVNVQTGGVLDLNGHPQTIGSLTLNAGTVETDAGVLTLAGPVTSQGFGGTIDGKLSLGSATRTFEVAPLATLTVNAVISSGSLSSAGLWKTGGGTLRLMGANSFLGGVQVLDGTLSVGHASALGSSLLQGTSVAPGAFVRLLNGVVVPSEALSLNGGYLYGEGDTTWAGPVTLSTNSHIRSLVANQDFYVTGVISGSAGFTHAGPGKLILGGTNANTFTGRLHLTKGDLWLAKSTGKLAVPGDLVIGSTSNTNNENLLWIQNGEQIGDASTVTLLSSAMMSLNSVTESIGALVLDGAEVNTGPGTLALNGDVTAQLSTDTSRITGRLSLGAAPRTFNVLASPTSPALDIAAVIGGTNNAALYKTGGGTLALGAANTYPGRTEVHAGTLLVRHHQGLGQADNGGGNQHPTVVFNGASLALDQVQVAGENLGLIGQGVEDAGALVALTGINSWSGRIQLTTWTAIRVEESASLNLSGILYDDADLTKLGKGILVFSGAQANSGVGTTFVHEGTLRLNKSPGVRAISGRLHIGNTQGSSATVKTYANDQIGNIAHVQINPGGLLDLNGHSEFLTFLYGRGRIALGAGSLSVATGIFAGEISGSGSLHKLQNAPLRLTGTNIHTGPTTVEAGQLIVHGGITASPVHVEPGATLAGSGFIAAASLDNATLSPGSDIFDISRLRLGSLFLTNGSTYRFEARAYPDGGWERDNVEVSGIARLTGASLDVHLGSPGATNIGYQLLTLTGNDAVQGTFDGLPQDASLSVAGAQLEIDYFSGTGNDIVLRQLTVATNDFEVRLHIEPLTNNTWRLSWPAFASDFELQSSTNLADGSWITENPYRSNDGTNQITDFDSGTVSNRFFRLVRPQN